MKMIVWFFRDTYIEREKGETSNDRNDRAIRTACRWYQKHLDLADGQQGPQRLQVVLLTNDAANRAKAKEEGILAYTGTCRVCC